VKIIIVGAGEVGRHLAETLSSQQHDIFLIETSEALAEELDERLNVHVLCGNGSLVSNLAEVNAPECDLFLALTSDDNANLVAASLAKSLGARKTVARVHVSLQREEWLFDYRSHFRIDYLFSTQRLAAIELAKHVRNPEGLLVEEFARGRIELQQTVVAAESAVLGKCLKDRGLPPRVRIGSIQRQDHHLVPTANDILQEGDLVTLFGEPRKLGDVLAQFQAGGQGEGELNVVIFGGGEYGFTLAQMLESAKYRVRILERNEKLCREISSTLQRTTVINGDATSIQQLKEEQISEADFFIAATNDDEDNVMACLQAKNLGTRYCLTLIHRTDYAEVISKNSEQLRIHAAVSPRVTSSRDLLRFVTTERFHVVMSLADGAEVIESVIGEHGELARKRVAEVPWPEGSGLVALLQGSEATVPTADDVIQAGDTIYALVSAEAKKAFVRLLADR
jgi:trk system potassium uptake protein TrkA